MNCHHWEALNFLQRKGKCHWPPAHHSTEKPGLFHQNPKHWAIQYNPRERQKAPHTHTQHKCVIIHLTLKTPSNTFKLSSNISTSQFHLHLTFRDISAKCHEADVDGQFIRRPWEPEINGNITHLNWTFHVLNVVSYVVKYQITSAKTLWPSHYSRIHVRLFNRNQVMTCKGI
jgi:hypothetical protein